MERIENEPYINSEAPKIIVLKDTLCLSKNDDMSVMVVV